MGGINTSAPTFAPGSTFAGYRIEAEAGRGGMGIVYRATQVALGRPVALKLIAANFAGDRSFRERFKREWETAASIDHPNVIPVYEAGEAEEHLFIAMRYVEGLDLANLLAREPELAPERAVRIIAQVAAALDAAHARGLVHRDVKPANVLIGAEEHVYLTDFGLTKHASQDALTKTGLFVGSVDYAAPEQIRGEAMDARTDVYSLGCVLYQTLTKRLPYDKPADVAKMYAHVSEPPPLVSAARLDGSTAFDAVVVQAMAKEPDDRYQSAGEFAKAAQDALAGVRAAGAEAQDSARRRPTRRRRPATSRSRAGPKIAASASGCRRSSWPGWPRRGWRRPACSAEAKTASRPPWRRRPRPRRRRRPRHRRRRRRSATGQPKAVATIKVGKGPDGVAVSGGSVFVANQQDGTLSVIDPEANEVSGDPIKAGTRPDGVVAGKGVVWLASARLGRRAALPGRGRDRPDRQGPRRRPAGGDQRSASSSSGSPTSTTTRSTASTEPRRRSSAARSASAPSRPASSSAAASCGWPTTATTPSPASTRRRPRSSATRSRSGKRPRGVIETESAAWIANSGDGTVTRLNRKTGDVLGTTKVGRNPRQLAFGNGFVWVTNNADNTVTRLDPNTGRVVGSPIPVGQKPLGIASGAGAVWVANHADHSITRIQP